MYQLIGTNANSSFFASKITPAAECFKERFGTLPETAASASPSCQYI